MENEKIENKKLGIRRKKIKNTIFTSTIIAAEETFDNFNKGTEKAVILDYDTIQQKIIKHKKELIKNLNAGHQINILTTNGWRSGKRFDGYNIDFYDPAIYYNDDYDTIEGVIAIQIIEY